MLAGQITTRGRKLVLKASDGTAKRDHHLYRL